MLKCFKKLKISQFRSLHNILPRANFSQINDFKENINFENLTNDVEDFEFQNELNKSQFALGVMLPFPKFPSESQLCKFDPQIKAFLDSIDQQDNFMGMFPRKGENEEFSFFESEK